MSQCARNYWDSSPHTPVGRGKNTSVRGTLRKNQQQQTTNSALYLCGWTLQAIKSSRHNVNGCGAFENVKVKQVGSVSEKDGTKEEELEIINMHVLWGKKLYREMNNLLIRPDSTERSS